MKGVVMSLFEYVPHPRITTRKLQPPPTVKELHKPGFNGWLARMITEGVGTMWCAYAFAALALVALPSAIKGGSLTIVQWVSQTFLQLTLLSIIMVGQQVLGAASDERAINTYADAEAILKEAAADPGTSSRPGRGAGTVGDPVRGRSRSTQGGYRRYTREGGG